MMLYLVPILDFKFGSGSPLAGPSYDVTVLNYTYHSSRFVDRVMGIDVIITQGLGIFDIILSISSVTK